MTFGTWLRDARGAAGLTLRDLAKQVGCSHAHLSHLEQDRYGRPSEEEAVRIARALGLTAEEGLRAAGYAGRYEVSARALEVERILSSLSEPQRQRLMDIIRSAADMTEPRDGTANRARDLAAV